MKRALLLAVFALAPSFGMAQTKLPVFLVTDANPKDAAAQKVLHETREAIRASPGFRLVEEKRQWPYLKLTIIASSNADDATAAAHTVAYDSASMKMNGALVTFGLNHCTVARAEYCARNILGDVESAADQLRRDAPELFRALR
jgi:hypothetical protein